MDPERARQIVKEIRKRSSGVPTSMVRRQAALDVLVEQDLRQEQAASLGRVGRRIEAAIAAMSASADAWATEIDRRDEHARDWAEARRAALQARWELVVQREALGMTDHSVLDRVYPISQISPGS